MTAAATSARRCDACTACCDGWLKIAVHGHAVYPGKPCPFSSGHHCTIYDTRPQDPCRAFVCGSDYSLADITVIVTVDFAKWIKLAIPEDCVDLRRWYEAVSARASAKA